MFSRLYSKGKSHADRCVAIYYMKNYKEHTTRIGITVSKSRGKAVIRNRIKRRIREALRSLHPLMKEGYLIVVVARQASVTASYAEITESLYSLLKKAALLGEEQ